MVLKLKHNSGLFWVDWKLMDYGDSWRKSSGLWVWSGNRHPAQLTFRDVIGDDSAHEK